MREPKKPWRDLELHSEVRFTIHRWFRQNSPDKVGCLSDRQLLDLAEDLHTTLTDFDLISTD